MKITTWTIQTPRTIPKLVTKNIAQWKQILSKPVFLKIQLYIHFWSKCKKNKKKNGCNATFLIQPSEANTPAFQNTLTFAEYLFNSRSNMLLNLVHWNSLHTKKAILPSFQDKPHIFLVKNTTYIIGKLGPLRKYLA